MKHIKIARTPFSDLRAQNLKAYDRLNPEQKTTIRRLGNSLYFPSGCANNDGRAAVTLQQAIHIFEDDQHEATDLLAIQITLDQSGKITSYKRLPKECLTIEPEPEPTPAPAPTPAKPSRRKARPPIPSLKDLQLNRRVRLKLDEDPADGTEGEITWIAPNGKGVQVRTETGEFLVERRNIELI